MEKNCYIYTLIHVEAQKVFYVGRGTKRKGKCWRFSDHMCEARRGSSLHVHRKIRSILALKETVKFNLFCDNLTLEEAEVNEKALILAIGLDSLTNETPGGKDIRFLTSKEGIEKKQMPPRTYVQIQNHKRGAVNKVTVYVLTKETGVVSKFQSMHDAADYMGSSAATVMNWLKGTYNRPRISWKYDVSYCPFEQKEKSV